MPDTSGKLRLDVQRVALATVIEEAVTSAQPAADAKGIRLVQVLGSATLIEGDPGRLQQVVWNLVSNAIKFTPKGGKVQVTLRKVDSHVEVEVSDTGAGIRADVLPHVFQRFRQADPAAPGRHGGLGLGPAIAKNLVERHGGSVTAASGGEGLGSTFIVRLPLAPSHRREPEAASAVPAQLARLLDGTTVLAPAAALTALARLEDRKRALLAGFQATWPSRSIPPNSSRWSPVSPAAPAAGSGSAVYGELPRNSAMSSPPLT